jgi:hypothetical protein
VCTKFGWNRSRRSRVTPLHTHTHTHTHIYIYIYIYKHPFYMYMYVYMYICVYVRAYIYTNNHFYRYRSTSLPLGLITDTFPIAAMKFNLLHAENFAGRWPDFCSGNLLTLDSYCYWWDPRPLRSGEETHYGAVVYSVVPAIWEASGLSFALRLNA